MNFKRFFLAMMLIVALGSLTAFSANDKIQIKKPVKELPVFIKGANFQKGLPQGLVYIQFGIKEKGEIRPSDFMLSGRVVSAAKVDNGIVLELSGAQIRGKDVCSNEVYFEGDLNINISYNNPSKLSKTEKTAFLGEHKYYDLAPGDAMVIELVGTPYKVVINDREYDPFEFDQKRIDNRTLGINIISDYKSKLTPEYVFDFSKMYLDKKEVAKKSLTASDFDALVKRYSAGAEPAAEFTVYKWICEKPSDVKRIDCEVTSIITEQPKNKFKDAVDGTGIFTVNGNSAKGVEGEKITDLKMTGFDTGNDVKFSKKDYGFQFTSKNNRIVVGEDKTLRAFEFPDLELSYAGNEVTRCDGSKLVGIKMIGGETDGFVYRYFQTLPLLNDVQNYKLPEGYTAEEYVSPSGAKEQLANGGKEIASIRQKLEEISKQIPDVIGPDRLLLGLYGPVKEVTQSSTGETSSKKSYSFDRDGYFTDSPEIYLENIKLPWYKLPDRRSGEVIFTAKSGWGGDENRKFRLKVKRDSEGKLQRIDCTYVNDESYETGGYEIFSWSDYYEPSNGIQSTVAVKLPRLSQYGSGFWEGANTDNYRYNDNSLRPSFASNEGGGEGYIWSSDTKYNYLEFDSHGNWTKRSGVVNSTEEDQESIPRRSKKNIVETRTITYYDESPDARLQRVARMHPLQSGPDMSNSSNITAVTAVPDKAKDAPIVEGPDMSKEIEACCFAEWREDGNTSDRYLKSQMTAKAKKEYDNQNLLWNECFGNGWGMTVRRLGDNWYYGKNGGDRYPEWCYIRIKKDVDGKWKMDEISEFAPNLNHTDTPAYSVGDKFTSLLNNSKLKLMMTKQFVHCGSNCGGFIYRIGATDGKFNYMTNVVLDVSFSCMISCDYDLDSKQLSAAAKKKIRQALEKNGEQTDITKYLKPSDFLNTAKVVAIESVARGF